MLEFIKTERKVKLNLDKHEVKDAIKAVKKGKKNRVVPEMMAPIAH